MMAILILFWSFLDGGHILNHSLELARHLLVFLQLFLIFLLPVLLLIPSNSAGNFLQGRINLHKLQFPRLRFLNLPLHKLNQSFAIETSHYV